MADYSKWDAMARDEEAAEKREKELKRAQNRDRYFKEQEERKAKFAQEQGAKQAAAAEHHGHSHGGGEGDGHSHGGHDSHEGKQPLLTAPRRPACGCGYADVNEMKRAAEEAALQPQLSTAEKNAKKISAVHATREHGRELFQAGQYDEAYAVYERGVLIITGIFGVEPAVQEELTQLEVMLDLNMALCRLKKQEWKAAIDQCRMALQLDPSSVKAHYRIAQAHVGMAEWGDARESLKTASQLDSSAKDPAQRNKCAREIAALQADIRRKEAEEREKQHKYAKQLEAKLAKTQAAFAQPANSAEEAQAKQTEPLSTTAPSAASAPAAHDSEDVSDLAQCMRDATLHPVEHV